VKMESLDAFNKKAWENFTNNNHSTPRPNGIACPKCAHELVDTNQGITLASYPPQKDVSCPECGYRGYRWC